MNDFEKKYYEHESFWSEGAVADPFNLQRIKETEILIPEPVSSLLDVGCGNGVFTNYVAEVRKSLKVVGFDRSEEALKYIRTEKMLGDITNIPVADNEFDCVTCLEVIEHLPIPAFSTALSELARVAKDYVIISVPYKEDYRFAMTECPHCKTTFNREMHLNWFDDKRMETLFNEDNLKFIKSFTTVKHRLPLGYGVIEKYRLWKHNVHEFTSPICPVCGYEKADFNALPTQSIETGSGKISSKQQLKNALKKVWPKGKERPGFWIIALYQKNKI
jgi:ubiquinone/menaquinone biosynthesis C-methylase UbiE